MAMPISHFMGTDISVLNFDGELGQDVKNCIRAFSERLGCEVVELNVQIDICIWSTWHYQTDFYFRLPRNYKRTHGNSNFEQR
jgi:hypothetical protein